jgi:hypothetical protein
MVREAAEGIVLALPRKNVCADLVGASSLEIFNDRQADRTDGFALPAMRFGPQSGPHSLEIGTKIFEASKRISVEQVSSAASP